MSKEIIKDAKRFFEIKFEQLLLQVKIAQFRKIAYTQDELEEILEYVKYEDLLDKKENELIELAKANKDWDGDKMKHWSSLPEYKVTEARQKELSKELIGKELTADDLFDIIENLKR